MEVPSAAANTAGLAPRRISLGMFSPVNRLTLVLLSDCRQTRQTDRQTDSQTVRHTDRHTDTQTDTQTHRQTDRQTDRQTETDRDRP